MHPVRRRKKRPNNGIRSIEVCRGNNGFGFTISGQQPCILSCIVPGSPADRAGLRSGDYLIAVNGQNVSKVSHDDVVRLIGCSNGLLKLQIAENYFSDSSDEEHVIAVRSKPKHAHKARATNVPKSSGEQNRVAKVVRDLRTGVMFDNLLPGEESWDIPALPPPRLLIRHQLGGPKEELCFFLGYMGTIEMPKQIQPGCRSQVVRGCIKRLRAEKRSHTWVLMRVHSEGVTLTGAGCSVLADYPVHRIMYCGSSSDEDKKYVGLVTAAALEEGDLTPSSSCHIFAVQSSLAEHGKHESKALTFKINCTSGPLSEGCFEFPSTSEPVLNAIKSFCLTKDEENLGFDNALLLANSPQPSQAGSTAASSNSDSGIGFRDDCGNQSDRIVMVDIENQRLHIQQLCDESGRSGTPKTLDIHLAAGRGLTGPSPNLQQAFACVSALCPLPGDFDPTGLGGYASLTQRPGVPATSTTTRSRSPLNSTTSSSDDNTHHSRFTSSAQGSDLGKFADASAPPSRPCERMYPQSTFERLSSSSQSNPWQEQSVFYRLGILPDRKNLTDKSLSETSLRGNTKSADNLDQPSFSEAPTNVPRQNSKSYDNLIFCGSEMSYKLSPQVHGTPSGRCSAVSPLSVSYGGGDMVQLQREEEPEPCLSYSMSPRLNYVSSGSLQDGVDIYKSIYFKSADDILSICSSRSREALQCYKLSPKVFGVPRPLVTQSLEELKSPCGEDEHEDARLSVHHWGSLQDLRQGSPQFHTLSTAGSALEEKDGTDCGQEDDPAASWATSFEKLLDDPQGLNAFTEFLKKEFSQENIIFWAACQKYRECEDTAERRRLAQEIYDNHLAEGAPEPVNVDAHARQNVQSLAAVPVDLFAAAQKQVFNLMKFDSYPRFLKSPLYQEMVGQTRKLKKSRSDAEDRRRKSLLPWARKNRSKSKDRGESDYQLSLHRKDSEDGNWNRSEVTSSRSSLASWDLALRGSFSRQSSTSREGDGALVRVVLADGATAVIQVRDGETVRELMERVLSKRGLTYSAFEVFAAGSVKPTSLDEDAAVLSSHEVRLEHRVLFRLDLPNRKTVSVKAKASKTLAQVLRPVLHKYNYPLEMVTICSVSESEVVELSLPIVAVDGRRLTVLTRSSEVWQGEPLPIPLQAKTFVKPGVSLDEITNKVFAEVLQGKTDAGSSAPGSVRSDGSSSTLPRFLRRDSALADKLRLRGRKSVKGVVGNKVDDTEDLYEGLKRAQRSRLEDQRGTEINFELPDFLKDKENAPQGVKKMRKLGELGTAEVEEGSGASTLTSHTWQQPVCDTLRSEKDNVSICPSTRSLDPKRTDESVGHVKALTCKTYETPKTSAVVEANSDTSDSCLTAKGTAMPLRKSDPPPLPPKPKHLPPKAALWSHNYRLPQETILRNHNFMKPSDVKSFAKLNKSRRAAYLDETSSSVV